MLLLDGVGTLVDLKVEGACGSQGHHSQWICLQRQGHTSAALYAGAACILRVVCSLHGDFLIPKMWEGLPGLPVVFQLA